MSRQSQHRAIMFTYLGNQIRTTSCQGNQIRFNTMIAQYLFKIFSSRLLMTIDRVDLDQFLQNVELDAVFHFFHVLLLSFYFNLFLILT